MNEMFLISPNQTWNEVVTKALSNTLIMDNIFKHLNLKDVKSCRLVNHCWLATSKIVFRQRSRIEIRVTTNYSNHPKATHNAKKDVKLRLVNLRRLDEILSSGQYINSQNLFIWGEDNFFPFDLIENLFHIYGSQIRKLKYVIQLGSPNQTSVFSLLLPKLQNLQKLEICLEFPTATHQFYPFVSENASSLMTLTHLQLEIGYESSMQHVDYSTLHESYFKMIGNLPNLVKLFPTVSTLILLNYDSQEIFSDFQQALLYPRNSEIRWNLSKLAIALYVDDDYRKFSDLKFEPTLSSMNVSFPIYLEKRKQAKVVRAYKTLLRNHASTLTKLTLTNGVCEAKWLATFDLALPIMPNLKKLTVHLMDFTKFHFSPLIRLPVLQYKFKFYAEADGILDYSKQFPQLMNLSFSYWGSANRLNREKLIMMTLQEFVPSNLVRCTALQHFDFELGFKNLPIGSRDSFVVDAFPNVHNSTFNKIRLRELSLCRKTQQMQLE